MRPVDPQVVAGWPRPGRTLKGVMLVLFGIWLAFALGLNWGNVPSDVFLLFAGNTDAILAGQVWRIATAPLIHEPSVLRILFLLLGFYFLTPRLEEQWGGARLLRFLAISVVFAYAFQMAFELLLPESVAKKLIPPYWYTAVPALEASAAGWALTFKGQTVRLGFILPVTSRGLILFVVGMSVLYVITLETPACGLISPFGGMIAGWLFGGGTPAPARRFWLKLRLVQLEREAARDRQARKQRVQRAGLRVIEGGAAEGGKVDGKPEKKKGPDGRLLN
jgi:membrane associated rhomboid family serine protease